MLNQLKKVKTLACLTAAAVLAGCANYPSATLSPENLLLILHQDITVESGRARVFIQQGEVTGTGSLQTYEPSCDFEVMEVSGSGSEQVILADTFRVTRVHNTSSVYASRYEPYEQYAMDGGREYLNTTYLTEFTLRSELQPGVLRLNCKIWSIDPFQRYLSPAQIGQTLGTIATFKSE